MKRFFLFAAVGFVLALSAACGSDDSTMDNQMQGDMGESMQGDMGDHMQDSGSMEMDEGGMQMMSEEVWVRSAPIDVKALDVDDDGYVYQDQMDWNVIADQEGKCPVCGMTLKKVTVAEAEQSLKDHGFEVASNG